MQRILLFILLTTSLFAKDIIAVLELEQKGLTKQEAEILTNRLTTKLVSIGKYQVVERSNMDKILKEQKFQQSGCTDSECAVEIGQLLNTDFIVIGSVSKFGSTWLIDSRLIDVAQGTVLISAEVSLEGKIDMLVTSGITSIANQLCAMSNEETAKPNQVVAPPVIKTEPNNRLETLNKLVDKKSYINSDSSWTRCFETMYMLPILSKVTRNEMGEITGTKGWGGTMGYYRKKYYNPIKYNQWNTFWHWGTMVYIPWIGIGREYVKENGNTKSISSWYFVPNFSFGKYFNKIENQNKWYVSVLGLSPPSFNTGINQISIILRYNNIQLSTGSLDNTGSDNTGFNNEISVGVSSIGYHFPLSNFAYFNSSYNFDIGIMNDISSEIGRQSVVLVDMNYELASKKKFGFGLRANIGLRIQEYLAMSDSAFEEYKTTYSVLEARGVYFNLSLLLLTFGD